MAVTAPVGGCICHRLPLYHHTCGWAHHLVLAVGDAQLAACCSVGLWWVPMLIERLRHVLRALKCLNGARVHSCPPSLLLTVTQYQLTVAVT
jgi:hypothetical protein